MNFIKKNSKILICIAIFIGILIVDLITKAVVASNMKLFETIPVIQDVFHITYVQNTGAAFSILEDKMLFFYIITPIALILGTWFLIKEWKHSMFQNVIIVSILAGALGNFIDRVFLGYVRDMFDFRLINFAVFNVADIALTVGCGVFIVFLIYDLFKDEKQKRDQNND